MMCLKQRDEMGRITLAKHYHAFKLLCARPESLEVFLFCFFFLLLWLVVVLKQPDQVSTTNHDGELLSFPSQLHTLIRFSRKENK